MTAEKGGNPSEAIPQEDFLLGEHPPSYVPIKGRIRSKRPLKTQEDFITEINEGEAAIRAARFSKMGRAVALMREGAGDIAEFVANHREHITGAAIVGAGAVAGVVTVVLLDEMREHVIPTVKNKIAKKSEESAES